MGGGQGRVLTLVVKVLVAGNIVAQEVACLPATKEWEAWPQLNVNSVVQFTHVAGGDVADFIPVVNISGRGWQGGLESQGAGCHYKNLNSLHSFIYCTI